MGSPVAGTGSSVARSVSPVAHTCSPVAQTGTPVAQTYTAVRWRFFTGPYSSQILVGLTVLQEVFQYNVTLPPQRL